MAERRPITLQARDGAVLRGFLTLPPGREPKHLPLVVMPHGGPFGSQDTWDWDADAQMLASRGYAVLQVNFRGSGRSEEHTSELQSLMRISYAVFCLKKKMKKQISTPVTKH